MFLNVLQKEIIRDKMTFPNDKKTFLAKLDKSKKGEVDEKVVLLLKKINSLEDYYTTSSCSGRVYFWRGTGKKNETEWLLVSHRLIREDFFALEDKKGLIWLRLEPFIIHICCRDLEAAQKLLDLAHQFYKKSALLSVRNKLIVEIRGSEFMEIPFYLEGQLLFSGEQRWLVELINAKLKQIWEKIEKFKQKIR